MLIIQKTQLNISVIGLAIIVVASVPTGTLEEANKPTLFTYARESL